MMTKYPRDAPNASTSLQRRQPGHDTEKGQLHSNAKRLIREKTCSTESVWQTDGYNETNQPRYRRGRRLERHDHPRALGSPPFTHALLVSCYWRCKEGTLGVLLFRRWPGPQRYSFSFISDKKGGKQDAKFPVQAGRGEGATGAPAG